MVLKQPKPKVIAEIGCNHMGRMDIAKELIRMASVFGNATVAKFQKRHPRELLSPEQYAAPHPNPYHSYGNTYGEHREFLELNLDQHRELKDYCDEFGIEYSSSVWDLTSAREIASLNPLLIKIPSAMNTHAEMVDWLCDHYGGELHISTGMTRESEIEAIVQRLMKKGRAGDTVLYACTSGYPVPFEDIRLHEIVSLRENYGGVVKEIGFSGHHLGIGIDIAAFAFGASWIERHFTLDRTAKGTDHAASLEPDGLRRLVRDLNAAQMAMGTKDGALLDIEIAQREKLKWKQVHQLSH